MTSKDKGETPEQKESVEVEGDAVSSSPSGVFKWARHRRIKLKGSPLTESLTAGPIFGTVRWDQTLGDLQDWSDQAVKYKSVTVGNIFHGTTFESVDVHEEHKKTRELISEKLADLAQKKDVIDAKEEIIEALKDRINELGERLIEANAEIAKTRELEVCAQRLCEEIRIESEETRNLLSKDLSDLRRYLSKFAPHRRFFRVTFGFLCFFLLTMLSNSVLHVRIVEPFWNFVGIVLTVFMLVVIYFGMKDVQEPPVDPGKH